jgi:hypothetical protein
MKETTRLPGHTKRLRSLALALVVMRPWRKIQAAMPLVQDMLILVSDKCQIMTSTLGAYSAARLSLSQGGPTSNLPRMCHRLLGFIRLIKVATKCNSCPTPRSRQDTSAEAATRLRVRTTIVSPT